MYSFPMVGRTLMHYKVVAELGAGGMGVVYEAVDTRLDRRVALKILPADKIDHDQRRERFLHEARTASALNDPHIVTIFDIFTADDTDVLVMELVPGRTLRQILDDGPLPLVQALDIAMQIAEGVGAAHAAGIVHRDLKPGNVMVTERGRIKVLDFGLAKLVGGSLTDQPTTLAPATVAGILLGTVDYMSPEQARGDPIDARTDVFSLGAMLYEMIAGVRPFTSGHVLGVLHEIVYGAIAPIRTRRPDATGDMERIVFRALERDVTRRYQTMEAFGDDLKRAHRDLVAGAPTRLDTPAPAFVPPPLPPSAAQPTAGQPAASQPAVGPPALGQPSATFTPVPLPVASTPPPAPASVKGGFGARVTGRQRYGRRARKRSFWSRAVIVLGILFVVNWGRGWLHTPSEIRRRDTSEVRPSKSVDVGQSIEDTIASGLLSFGSGSAEIQFASAQIYWSRARQTKDPLYLKKAEDGFNEAIRIGLDADDEKEARAALKEIAALKIGNGNTPPGGDPSGTSTPDARGSR